MGMIRQLGPPTLFCTFSMAETQWTPLIRTLFTVLKQQHITNEAAATLSKLEKLGLIKADPSTCAQYYHHKHRELIKVLKSPDGPFGEHHVEHFSCRKEAQQRGSTHNHDLYWNKNGPVFDKDNPESIKRCEEFIDKFITCKKDETLGDLMNVQYHKHTHTCYKKV